jgi:hypothetical protein
MAGLPPLTDTATVVIRRVRKSASGRFGTGGGIIGRFVAFATWIHELRHDRRGQSIIEFRLAIVGEDFGVSPSLPDGSTIGM